MEDGVVKQGFLYLQQQQTFGKKWRKFWGVLHSGGVCAAAACLELLEGSGPPPTETAKKAGSSKHLIKLSDCVHVAESAGEASNPKETIPFFLETTEKRYLLAAERTEAADWILVVCEHAFLKSRENWKTMLEKDLQKGKAPSVLMAENSLYTSTCKASAKEFPVTVKATQASERCQLWGRFLLRAKADALELCSIQKGDVFYTWPYKFLRRYGRDKVMFTFEAGRRCASGEGSFEFFTKQGDEIIWVIETAINAKRAAEMTDQGKGGSFNPSLKTSFLVRASSEARSYEEGALGEKVMAVEEGRPLHAATTKSLSLGSSCQGNPANKGRLVKPIPSCPLPSTKFSYLEFSSSLPRKDPQYKPGMLERAGETKVPQVKVTSGAENEESLDSVSKSLVSRNGSRPQQATREAPTPLVACDRSDTSSFIFAGSGLEHIYDDPETLVHVVYDEPQEIKGEAWKLQATAEDPVGHEYPYNPYLDDYSVPKMAASSTLRLSGQDRNLLEESAFDKMIQRVKKNQNAQ